LLCVALQKADDKSRKEVFKIMEETDDEKKISQMLIIYEKCGVREETVAQMEMFFNKSMKSLHSLSLNGENKELLLQLANSIYHRSF